MSLGVSAVAQGGPSGGKRKKENGSERQQKRTWDALCFMVKAWTSHRSIVEQGLAAGGWRRLAADGGWQLVVGGVGGWRLVAVGG